MEEQRQVGPLFCRFVGAAKPKRVVVLCHGYGAPGTDLVPLANALTHLRPNLEASTLFVFPQAPLKLSMGFDWMDSRAWWHIDVGRYERALATGSLREMANEEPKGLANARNALNATLDQLAKELGIPKKDFILGGFSQGAMLTTDVSLRMPEGPKALCILSGTLISARTWTELATKKDGLLVFQSHGTMDPILPMESAEWLRDLLEKTGAFLQFVPFRGEHGIPPKVLKELSRFLP